MYKKYEKVHRLQSGETFKKRAPTLDLMASLSSPRSQVPESSVRSRFRYENDRVLEVDV